MSTAITTTTDRRTDVAAFEPGSIDEALSVSKLLVSSRLLPRSITTPEAAFAVIVTGRELGLSAMQSLRAIHIVEGKPTLSADLMVAMVKKSDACLFFRLVESSATVALYETHRRGEPSPTRLSFTLEEAKAAGVTGKDNWRKYPAAMLRARAAAALARAVYPDLVLGVYDPDELGASTIDVTPAPAPAPVVGRVVESAPVAAPAPAPVAPPPAPAARRKKAEPAPAPAPAPAPEVEEAEVVEAVPADGLATELDQLLEAIAGAPDVSTAIALLTAAEPADLGGVSSVLAFEAVLGRCTSAAECNEAAGAIAAWKGRGPVADELVTALRGAYSTRKAAIIAAGKAAP